MRVAGVECGVEREFRIQHPVAGRFQAFLRNNRLESQDAWHVFRASLCLWSPIRG
jgi:hypothetical protein